MFISKKVITIAAITLTMAACESQEDKRAKMEQEYTSQQKGKVVFEKNCISCHGEGAKGLSIIWRKAMPNRKFPAPPLDGSAHAWHHPPKMLLATINNGGKSKGGWMPSFKDKLSDDEKTAVLEYLFSLWPTDTQEKYNARFK